MHMYIFKDTTYTTQMNRSQSLHKWQCSQEKKVCEFSDSVKRFSDQ